MSRTLTPLVTVEREPITTADVDALPEADGVSTIVGRRRLRTAHDKSLIYLLLLLGWTRSIQLSAFLSNGKRRLILSLTGAAMIAAAFERAGHPSIRRMVAGFELPNSPSVDGSNNIHFVFKTPVSFSRFAGICGFHQST